MTDQQERQAHELVGFITGAPELPRNREACAQAATRDRQQADPEARRHGGKRALDRRGESGGALMAGKKIVTTPSVNYRPSKPKTPSPKPIQPGVADGTRPTGKGSNPNTKQ